MPIQEFSTLLTTTTPTTWNYSTSSSGVDQLTRHLSRMIECNHGRAFSQLCPQIRYTKRVSMFPVGLIAKAGVSSPIVQDGVFSGFYDGWIGGRKFAVDMAGFAVSVKFLIDRPKASMPLNPASKRMDIGVAHTDKEECTFTSARHVKIQQFKSYNAQANSSLARVYFEAENLWLAIAIARCEILMLKLKQYGAVDDFTTYV
ncbi:hypothetical protein NQ318_017771 [Aromia moschata]|uniref:Galactosylgalactosylxylosylprotein 3-beta-glucuronosyltransferase n=1 Tax=Aromia moschata TaxID=1265417 RepID=A0AAV8XTU5_9CUCU|nr:hypothetical protein NQ318_017771 [Aromia moschata]